MFGDKSTRRTDAHLDTLKRIRRLARSRRARDDEDAMFVEGVRNFLQCNDRAAKIETAVVCPGLLTSVAGQTVLRRLKRDGCPIVRVGFDAFRSISVLPKASGIGLIIRQPWGSLDPTPDRAIWICVEHIRSPGNLGTLMRSCAAVEAAGVIIIGNEIDPFDPAVVRASMGSIFDVRVVRTSATQLRSWARSEHIRIIGATAEGMCLYRDAAYTERCVLMLGHERNGLSPSQMSLCDTTIRIPISPVVDSLNVGVAGSLLLYEAAARSELTPSPLQS